MNVTVLCHAIISNCYRRGFLVTKIKSLLNVLHGTIWLKQTELTELI